eukprot:m.18380 g.18380  ORF g.18380 m.18380 type:complete len:205 (+) comp11972_c0_seq1:211-825(+)
MFSPGFSRLCATFTRTSQLPCTIVASAAASHSNVMDMLALSTVNVQNRTISTNSRKKKVKSNGKISVVLLQEVEGLGVAGKLVDVKRGYARNYLIPNRMARKDSGDASASELLAKSEILKQLETNQKIGQLLSTTKILFKRQEGNKFTISPALIAAHCYKQHQLDVPIERLLLEAPITAYGDHEVPVMIDDEFPGTLHVSVIKR